MTTKTETVHKHQDFLGNILKNWQIQSLTADPNTTYPRIYWHSVDLKYRQWVGPTGADWDDFGGTFVLVDDSVTNAKLAEMPANTVKANITGGLANPTDVTLANFKTWLALVKADVGLGNVTNTSDANKPVSTAQQTALDLKLDDSQLDADGTLAANSDLLIPTQKAVRTAINALLAAQDAFVYKGTIDCSANPNYPAADAGHVYRVSVAGKIGGAAGPNVEVGDRLECLVDGTAAGNHATVGANWNIIQVNIDGAVIGPAAATDGDIALFNGATGKIIKVLSGANDDFAQRKAGVWTNRTVAQVKTDLGILGTETHKYAATIGDGATADIVVTHNLNTKDVQTTVRYVANDEPTSCFPVPTSVNQVTIYFPTAPANNEFRVVVIG